MYELNPALIRSLKKLGFSTPTPIQNMAIPPLMRGNDVLAAAATGSGKTAAFLLPILHSLLSRPRGKTRALVLAPTRELAAQIVDHFQSLASGTPLKAAAVYGGVGMEPQVLAFKRGVDLIAATPGRLLDHFQNPYAQLKDLEVLVLDEADRMLDMGFLPDVKKIIAALPSRQQTMLFSATMPRPIIQLAEEMLREPVALNIQRKSAPAEGISHTVFPVPHELKKDLLLQLLRQEESRSVLAFTRTKHRANRLADFLSKNGIPCERIHGNRTQHQRTAALQGFKDGRYRVLVATDIAARGIDVVALGLVVNFDVPNLPEDYIHRVGRTARAELSGNAFTFVSPGERSDLHAIERHLGKAIPSRKLEGFDYNRNPSEQFEIPIGERIAAIRTRRSQERSRARAKAEARTKGSTEPNRRPSPRTHSRNTDVSRYERAAADSSHGRSMRKTVTASAPSLEHKSSARITENSKYSGSTPNKETAGTFSQRKNRTKNRRYSPARKA
ncbi:MAG TPA: DEAD/DEAH box helicase [Thermoanaerobaculia bacterium]|nr:DEAD/DEAH box helicase [Thermoanaerobaculia bacterium]HUM30076.1 DEAD/DEAH box helicase [Thermoanaerobaculia bacterium]HXK69428.1 DEAD/DEAH box helicase [Thermoanaerobaculia bacterium]